MSRTQVVCWTVFAMTLALNGQSVVVNEMSQGSGGGREWVELLVVDNGVDLRGWELGDNDDGNWHPIAVFTDHADWSYVTAGTIIVIYNSGDVDGTIISAGGEDTDLADKSVRIGVNNTSYFSDIGPWGSTTGAFANTDNDDCAAIRDADDIIIHDMAASHPTATVPGPGSAKVKYYTGNSVLDIADDSKWIEATSSQGSPGLGNGGDNSTWIDSSLPVVLSSWSGFATGGQVHLSWTTESETENQGFIIYRRRAGQQAWQEISSFINNARLLGHGSTTGINNYTFADTDVVRGQTYIYQLTDVDYRNQLNPHDKIRVTVPVAEQQVREAVIDVHPAYPNPFNASVHLNFTLDRWLGSPELHIYDLRGTVVKKLSGNQHKAGEVRFAWEGNDTAGRKLDSGIYIARLAGYPGNHAQRITLVR